MLAIEQSQFLRLPPPVIGFAMQLCIATLQQPIYARNVLFVSLSMLADKRTQELAR